MQCSIARRRIRQGAELSVRRVMQAEAACGAPYERANGVKINVADNRSRRGDAAARRI